MLELGKRFSSRIHKPQVVCEFEEHSEGYWKINGKLYRPTWPRGFDEGSREDAEEMVKLGIAHANQVYQNTEKHPKSVRVERYYGERFRIIMVDK